MRSPWSPRKQLRPGKWRWASLDLQFEKLRRDTIYLKILLDSKCRIFGPQRPASKKNTLGGKKWSQGWQGRALYRGSNKPDFISSAHQRALSPGAHPHSNHRISDLRCPAQTNIQPDMHLPSLRYPGSRCAGAGSGIQSSTGRCCPPGATSPGWRSPHTWPHRTQRRPQSSPSSPHPWRAPPLPWQSVPLRWKASGAAGWTSRQSRGGSDGRSHRRPGAGSGGPQVAQGWGQVPRRRRGRPGVAAGRSWRARGCARAGRRRYPARGWPPGARRPRLRHPTRSPSATAYSGCTSSLSPGYHTLFSQRAPSLPPRKISRVPTAPLAPAPAPQPRKKE